MLPVATEHTQKYSLFFRYFPLSVHAPSGSSCVDGVAHDFSSNFATTSRVNHTRNLQSVVKQDRTGGRDRHEWNTTAGRICINNVRRHRCFIVARAFSTSVVRTSDQLAQCGFDKSVRYPRAISRRGAITRELLISYQYPSARALGTSKVYRA